MQDQLNNINGENQDVVIQYQRLVQILQDYRNESLTDAAKVYTDMQPELITDAGMQEILASISADMTENGYQLFSSSRRSGQGCPVIQQKLRIIIREA